MPLLETDPNKKSHRPYDYDWANEYTDMQHNLHWLPREISMGEDVKDWRHSLTKSEVSFLTHVFQFFTQADIDVNDCYMSKYTNVFKNNEVKDMLVTFSAMEVIHVKAYSHLIDTLGLPETIYDTFLEYESMQDKHNYGKQFSTNSKYDLAVCLAAFGAFTEGMQLFASFAMLLNFTRHGLMKGMGSIVTYSIRDETLHTKGIIKIFHTLLEENEDIDRAKLKVDITEVCKTMVINEDKFIDLAFEMGDQRELTADDMKLYVRFVADTRMVQLGYEPIYNIGKHPLPWLPTMLHSVEHANFFESNVTTYSKNAVKGDVNDL